MAEDQNGSSRVRIPLNNEYWIHRLIDFARRLKDIRELYIQRAIVRFYGNKIVIEMTPENAKKFNDLLTMDMDGLEIRETDKDSDVAFLKRIRSETPEE